MAYLGDSAPAGLDANPAMYEAKVLICELTFVAPDHRKDKIHKFGHMHLDDLVERRDRFKNELVIAAHLSTRYHAKTGAGARREGDSRHARRPAALVAVEVGACAVASCATMTRATLREPTPAYSRRTLQCAGDA